MGTGSLDDLKKVGEELPTPDAAASGKFVCLINRSLLFRQKSIIPSAVSSIYQQHVTVPNMDGREYCRLSCHRTGKMDVSSGYDYMFVADDIILDSVRSNSRV